MNATPFQRPYVVSWNLTYRCNLACEHCYLDAGGKPKVESEAFADRSELTTEQCFEVVDQIAEFAPESLTILTGGEPLLRRDILEIIRYAASRKLWVVVGTNGVKITETLAGLLKKEGVRGIALSLDALDASRHDGFRRVRGAWENTVKGAKILAAAELPFIVQTTIGSHNRDELKEIADFAYEELGAKVWNLYFLVPTGRGGFVTDLEPAEYDRILLDLHSIQQRFEGKMVVNAKCAPHYVKTLYSIDPESPFLKQYSGGAGGCPAGTHYMGIRPNGDVTPCPYLPEFGGNLHDEKLSAIWKSSELFERVRARNQLGGKCGECELSTRCGGCRARAFGATGDVMAADPLCTHETGSLTGVVESAAAAEPALAYGLEDEPSLDWDEDARERMSQVPAFVRGMVTKRVERYCRDHGQTRVTIEVLTELRARMPANRIFGRRA